MKKTVEEPEHFFVIAGNKILDNKS